MELSGDYCGQVAALSGGAKGCHLGQVPPRAHGEAAAPEDYAPAGGRLGQRS